MTTEDNNARDQAKAQLESIKEMVAALNVDYDMLNDLKEAPANTMIEISGLEIEPDQMSHDANGCESLEEAQQRIHEDPLSVEVRSGWYSPGGDGDRGIAEEFQILLCTGGPAVRIIGDLDEHCQPEKPHIQYQDWGTPWTDYWLTSEEEEIVTEYCQQFYFGG